MTAANTPVIKQSLSKYNKMVLTNIAASLGCNIQVQERNESSVILLVSKNGSPKLYDYVQIDIMYALNTQCLAASMLLAFTAACHSLYEQARCSK